jgi:23S rRNA (cytosine1962-C5)-methyltransferase
VNAAPPKLKLKKRLERVLREGHPWIFRDALAGRLPAPGRVVTVVDARGRFVVRGLSEAGPIGLRVFTTRDEPVDAGLFARRIRAAADLRRRVVPPGTTAFRLLHGEGDRLPGVVCDVYACYAVLRFDGQAARRWQPAIVEALAPVLSGYGVQSLLLRTGRGESRRVEALTGEPPGAPVEVREHGMCLRVDLLRGQKTGLFLDHRESRLKVRSLAADLLVLNLYGYTGGFSVAAGLGGAAEVDTVDVAAPALRLADLSWSENGLDPARHRSHAATVQDFLAAAGDRGGRYDLIVADPPSFAPSEGKVRGALRAYEALHRGALDRLAPGGLYLAASCSSHVRRDPFERTVLDAARKAGRALQILDRWGAPADHPRLAAFPEGDYLKVLLARVP